MDLFGRQSRQTGIVKTGQADLRAGLPENKFTQQGFNTQVAAAVIDKQLAKLLSCEEAFTPGGGRI